MRLINVHTLELEEYYGIRTPPYAILSHTWGDEEVTLQQWEQGSKSFLHVREGYKKILGACAQTKRDELDYLWVDTNCIDKTNSAELSEAINSMFAWYASSKVCYVYLSDFEKTPTAGDPEAASHGQETSASLTLYITQDGTTATPPNRFFSSRWFTRGWTLQELLAPSVCQFFTKNWELLGSKTDQDLAEDISEVTGISELYVANRGSILSASISKRMSWIAGRQTTRPEDLAYCMLGIFDINMPLLYGEGTKAFGRLQEEIMKTSIDQTLFAWTWPISESERYWVPPFMNEDELRVDGHWVEREGETSGWWESHYRESNQTAIMAPTPQHFSDTGMQLPEWPATLGPEDQIYTSHNLGLSIRLHLIATASPDLFLAVLCCRSERDAPATSATAIPVWRSGDVYRRAAFPPWPLRIELQQTPTWPLHVGRHNYTVGAFKTILSDGLGVPAFRGHVVLLAIETLDLWPNSTRHQVARWRGTSRVAVHARHSIVVLPWNFHFSGAILRVVAGAEAFDLFVSARHRGHRVTYACQVLPERDDILTGMEAPPAEGESAPVYRGARYTVRLGLPQEVGECRRVVIAYIECIGDPPEDTVDSEEVAIGREEEATAEPTEDVTKPSSEGSVAVNTPEQVMRDGTG